jgi:hypothetical protein
MSLCENATCYIFASQIELHSPAGLLTNRFCPCSVAAPHLTKRRWWPRVGIVTSGKKRLPSPHCRLAKPLNLLNPSLAVRQVVSSKNG